MTRGILLMKLSFLQCLENLTISINCLRHIPNKANKFCISFNFSSFSGEYRLGLGIFQTSMSFLRGWEIDSISAWMDIPSWRIHCFRLMIEYTIVITFHIPYLGQMWWNQLNNAFLEWSRLIQKLYLAKRNWLNISMYWLSITAVERSRRFGEITARIERGYWLCTREKVFLISAEQRLRGTRAACLRWSKGGSLSEIYNLFTSIHLPSSCLFFHINLGLANSCLHISYILPYFLLLNIVLSTINIPQR